MSLFFIYPGSKGSGLESTLAPYEIAKQMGVDARLFLSKDNQRRTLVSELYPEAEFFNFLSPSDIFKMRKKIKHDWSFFTMASPKMIPLFYSTWKKKLFYLHETLDPTFTEPTLGNWFMLKLIHSVIRNSNLTLVHTPHQVCEVESLLNAKVDCLPHPSFSLKPRFFAKEKELSLPFERFFLYFGDVDREGKGVKLLLKALELHPEINAVIAGRGKELPKMKNLVHLRGWTSEGEMHYLIKKSCAVVLPYLVTGQFSGCMALSFHFRTPVIGSDLPTFQGAIDEDRTGWVFPSGDYRALGDKMKEVWEGKRAFSKEAIERKEKEMDDLTRKRFREILDRIVYEE